MAHTVGNLTATLKVTPELDAEWFDKIVAAVADAVVERIGIPEIKAAMAEAKGVTQVLVDHIMHAHDRISRVEDRVKAD